MDKAKLLSVMKKLSLPKGQFAIFGGACLTAHDIRPTSDLEIFVTPDLYAKLKRQGWQERVTGSTGATYQTKTILDVPILVFVTCGSDRWQPNADAYITNPEIISDLPLMPLREMRAWKAATARPKDLIDVKLIDVHFAENTVRA